MEPGLTAGAYMLACLFTDADSGFNNNPVTSIHENHDAALDIWAISANCTVRYTIRNTCYAIVNCPNGTANCTQVGNFSCYAHVFSDEYCDECSIDSDLSDNFEMIGTTVRKKECGQPLCAGQNCTDSDGCLNGGDSHSITVSCRRTGFETDGEITKTFTVSVNSANGPAFSYGSGSSINVTHDIASAETVINTLNASLADNENDKDYARYRQASGPDPSYLHGTTDLFYLDTGTGQVKVKKDLTNEFSYWYDMSLCVIDRRDNEVCHTLDITLWACFQTPNCTDQEELNLHDTYGTYTGHGGSSNTIFDMIFGQPTLPFTAFNTGWHDLTWTFDLNEFPEAAINATTGEIYITRNISIWPSWPTKDYNQVVRVANSESCYTTTCSFDIRVHYTNWPISIASLPTTYSLHEDWDSEILIHSVITFDYNYYWEDNVTCTITNWFPTEANMFELRHDGNHSYNSYSLYKLACQVPDCGYKYQSPRPYYCDTDIGCLTYNRTQQYTVTIRCEDGYNTSDTQDFTLSVLKNEVPIYRHLPTSIDLDRQTVSQFDRVFEIMFSDAEGDDLIFEYTYMDVDTNIDPGYFVGDALGNYYDNIANITMTTYLHDKPVNKTYRIQICGHERRNEICDPLDIDVEEYCSDPPFCSDNSLTTDTDFAIGDTLFDIKSLVYGGTFADENLSFSIKAEFGNLFSIDSSSGVVTTAAEFPEVFPSTTYSIIGYVYHSGSCSYGQCQLTVRVSAINYALNITNLPDTAYIHEDTTTPIDLFTVATYDANTDDSYICGIVNADAAESFYLERDPPGSGDYIVKNQENGVLSSATTTYSVSIECVDSHGDGDSDVLTVEVGLNEAPVFTGFTGGASINADVMNYSLGDVIYSVPVTDTENDNLIFTTTNRASNVPFGYVEYVTYLDVVISRDLRIDYDNGETYEATICVRDAKHTDLCETLSVSFTRAKTRPYISNLDSTVTFSEDTPLATTLFAPAVVDPDVGETHTFSIAVQPSSEISSFQLDRSTGEVTLSQTLDYEQDTRYFLTYNVSDEYLPAEFLKTLILDVTNVNEGNTISATYTTISFPENTPANTKLTNPGLTCVDDDGDTTSFAIDSGLHSGYFSIDSSTGRITLIQEWDLESGLPPSTSLTISCTDPGGLSSDIVIFFNIEDVNDNRPNLVTSDTLLISISPSTCLCTDLMTFDVSDNDYSDDGVFEYSMLGNGLGARFFRLVPVTGTTQAKLRLSTTPNFANDKLFSVSIMASDGESSPLFSRITIEVNYTAGDPDAKSKEKTRCLTCTKLGKFAVGALSVEAFIILLFGLQILFTFCRCNKTLNIRPRKMDNSRNQKFQNTTKQVSRNTRGKNITNVMEMKETERKQSRNKQEPSSESESSSSESSDDEGKGRAR